MKVNSYFVRRNNDILVVLLELLSNSNASIIGSYLEVGFTVSRSGENGIDINAEYIEKIDEPINYIHEHFHDKDISKSKLSLDVTNKIIKSIDRAYSEGGLSHGYEQYMYNKMENYLTDLDDLDKNGIYNVRVYDPDTLRDMNKYALKKRNIKSFYSYLLNKTDNKEIEENIEKVK